MPENLYEDMTHAEEVKRRKQVAVTMDTYVNTDDCSDTNTKRENSNRARNLQVQHTVTGNNSTWNKCYSLTSACMLLLCVLLLITIMVLWMKFINQQTTEYKQLQTRFNNLTIERDQLQTSYNNLTIARDQLQKQKDILQKRLTSVGWILFNSTLYYLSTEKKNWTDSRQDCINRGADLMIINSKEEQDFVWRKNNKSGVYIGLTDQDKEGVYKWVDGTSLTTAYWSSGNIFSDLDDCVVNGFSGSTGWYDRPCAETYYWMCE